MRVEYDPKLMEQAVFLAARRDRRVECALHEAIDPLYQMPPGRQREAAFQKTHASLFVRYGLDGLMDRLLAEQPLIAGSVDRCIVREAARRSNESAELFVRKASRVGLDPPYRLGSSMPSTATTLEKTLIIQVAASSLLEPDGITPFFRRELSHVADMLDPQFQYRPQKFEGTPARQNLVHHRYRLLWDIYVEARLHRNGQGEERTIARLRDMFTRLFKCEADEAARSAFDAIFETPHLTHPQLMAWATQPGIGSMPSTATTLPVLEQPLALEQ